MLWLEVRLHLRLHSPPTNFNFNSPARGPPLRRRRWTWPTESTRRTCRTSLCRTRAEPVGNKSHVQSDTGWGKSSYGRGADTRAQAEGAARRLDDTRNPPREAATGSAPSRPSRISASYPQIRTSSHGAHAREVTNSTIGSTPPSSSGTFNSDGLRGGVQGGCGIASSRSVV